MTSLRVQGLSKSFQGEDGPITVIDGVSFEASESECYALLGRSGCGKTTTLRCIAGLEEPDDGRIEIAGRVVFDASRKINAPTHERSIGVVFQSYAIWPHMNVFENVSYPLRFGRQKLPKGEIEARVMECLSLVGMADLARRPAPRLSGGQQQRVALARAIARRPALLLLDEPLSNLDAILREQMRRELAEIIGRVGITALLVTHDQAEAFILAHRVAVMNKGRIAQEGAPRSIHAKPQDAFVAEFLGASNSLTGAIIGREGADVLVAIDGAHQTLRMRSDLPEGEKIRLMLRPERLTLSSSTDANDARLHGCIVSIGFTGVAQDYGVRVGATTVRVLAPVDVAARVGDDVCIAMGDPHLMPVV